MPKKRRLQVPTWFGLCNIQIQQKKVEKVDHIHSTGTLVYQNDKFRNFGAQEKTRTSTPIRALAPEASASTNSATWAGNVEARLL